jgi:hypothetical protein
MDFSPAAVPCREKIPTESWMGPITPETLGRTLWDTHVVHTSPGRVRLRIPVLRRFSHLTGSLEALLRAQPGITDVSVNGWCQSVTLNYDPSYWTSDTITAFSRKLELRQIEEYEFLRAPEDQTVQSWTPFGIQPVTWWKVAAYFTLIVGIILFALPMIPGGTPLLILSSMFFSKASAFSLEEVAVSIV